MAASPIRNVAIVGATGHLGTVFAEALSKTGKHTVTGITRRESKGTLSEGVNAIAVDYDDETALVAALKGQQFVVVTLSGRAPPDTHSKIVKAAAQAGVPYLMPNVYGGDIENMALMQSGDYGMSRLQLIAEVQSLGIASITLVCGLWYEWSLALGERGFGFSIEDRKAICFDDGKTAINVSTWTQCGRALAALLSLPETGASPSLADWKNKPLYITSFRLSQRGILDSLHRVLGTSDEDWEITHEPSAKRYAEGREEYARGILTGFVKSIYARVFFPTGDGDFETTKGVANGLLGLPKEDLDTATKKALGLIKGNPSLFSVDRH